MLERTLNGVRERNAVTRTPARLRDGHRREVNPRARGERVSLSRAVRARAGGCRRLPQRLLSGLGRSPLRGSPLHDPPGRESLDSNGNDARAQGQGAEGRDLQGADADPKRRQTGPAGRHHAGPQPKPKDLVRVGEALRTQPRQRKFYGACGSERR